MKLNGIMGKGSGKLGSSVWGISGGVQVVREYNPEVTNPQTEAQTEQRAKFKLMTQLAAIMNGQIAFRKSGLTSARNKFVAANLPKVQYQNSKAEVAIENLDLTGGNSFLPLPTAVVAEGIITSVKLQYAAPNNVEKVVYNIYAADEDGNLVSLAEILASTAGANRDFEVSDLSIDASAYVSAFVLAYGMKIASESAKTKFENFEASEISQTGHIGGVVSVLRTLSISEYSLTETAGYNFEI